MEMLLYNSVFCRLCAEENPNGVLLFSSEEYELDLSVLVNKYLPFKIQDDGKLPRTICPGCHIQLQATVQFFELLVEGQQKIRDMWKNQLDLQKKLEKERLKAEHGCSDTLVVMTETNPELSDPSNQVVIEIMSDGTLFTNDHEMSLKMEGLEKPRRKRGRPPKKLPDPNEIPQPVPEPEPFKDEEEYDADGRKRRRRKVPKRFTEAVQGKELERIFIEEGVIDESEAQAEEEDYDDDIEEKMIDVTVEGSEEIIGHLETPEGKDLGELVVVNKSRGRGRPKYKKKKTRYYCEICGRGFLHKGRFLMHKSYHKKILYECLECKARFPTKPTLVEHQVEMAHQGEGIAELIEENAIPEELQSSTEDTIDQIRIQPIEIDSKIESVDMEEPQTYEFCDNQLENEEIYEDQMNNVDEDEINTIDEHQMNSVDEDRIAIKCDQCELTFQSISTLNDHIESIHENKLNFKKMDIKAEKCYPCDFCGKVFNHPSSAIYHKEAEHNGRRFVCNKCERSFKHKQLLHRHQLVHSNVRPHICTICKSSFKTKANLLNHMATHTGEKKYFCHLCNQQFAHKTSLTLHHRWHSGHKPFKCNVCNKSFSQNGNLQEHLRIHTGEKPFSCADCGRKFTTSSQFKLHMKRHTGERPWKCDFCSKTFLHKDTWKCHERRHKGEKPFDCSYCGRGFTEQWALKKHLRLHTGERPYTCDICGKTFADCSNLTKHKKVHKEGRDEAGNLANRSVWNIIRSHCKDMSQDNEELETISEDQTINNQENDDVQQVIFVRYQDPDDLSQQNSMQIVDEMEQEIQLKLNNEEIIQESTHPETIGEMEDPLSAVAAAAAAANIVLPGNEEQHELDINEDENNLLEQFQNHQINIGEGHSIQVTDEQGKPLHITMQDGRFIQITTSDGHSLQVTTPDGHTIPIELMPGDEEQDELAMNMMAMHENDTITINQISENSTDETLAQNANTDMSTLPSENTIEFTTEDGQKLRLVTYDGDPMSEYITVT